MAHGISDILVVPEDTEMDVDPSNGRCDTESSEGACRMWQYDEHSYTTEGKRV